MKAPAFTVTYDALRIPHISLGRLNVAHFSPEFRRVDPDGALAARIVQALAADEGLAEAIQTATFADPPAGV